MINSLQSTDYWRKRAEEMRALAEYLRESEARATMLQIADNYEFLAQPAKTSVPREG
jgi:hypothetical protein